MPPSFSSSQPYSVLTVWWDNGTIMWSVIEQKASKQERIKEQTIWLPHPVLQNKHSDSNSDVKKVTFISCIFPQPCIHNHILCLLPLYVVYYVIYFVFFCVLFVFFWIFLLLSVPELRWHTHFPTVGSIKSYLITLNIILKKTVLHAIFLVNYMFFRVLNPKNDLHFPPLRTVFLQNMRSSH